MKWFPKIVAHNREAVGNNNSVTRSSRAEISETELNKNHERNNSDGKGDGFQIWPQHVRIKIMPYYFKVY